MLRIAQIGYCQVKEYAARNEWVWKDKMVVPERHTNNTVCAAKFLQKTGR